MTTWFVSRHPGAIEWAARQGLVVDRQVAHLDIKEVQAGDTVIGILPVHLAAEVCARGARFLNLSLDVPPDARGQELDADALERFGARLETYVIDKLEEGLHAGRARLHP
ncbi:MAG: CRISPR-associated protein Csx16 [Rhodocyclaceae bacterium]